MYTLDIANVCLGEDHFPMADSPTRLVGAEEFLVEYIDAHYYSYEGPTLRDGMDQRVFNKFVMSKMEKRAHLPCAGVPATMRPL